MKGRKTVRPKMRKGYIELKLGASEAGVVAGGLEVIRNEEDVCRAQIDEDIREIADELLEEIERQKKGISENQERPDTQ